MDAFIREMTKDDLQSVVDIYNRAVLEGRSTFQSKSVDIGYWDDAHLADCRYVLVSDGNIAGWCALSSVSARECFRGVAEVSVYIDEKYRGLGFGMRLMERLCADSEEKGYWCLYSSIFSDNGASIRLHLKNGFREIGYREKIARDRFGVWRDTTLFERRNGIK